MSWQEKLPTIGDWFLFALVVLGIILMQSLCGCKSSAPKLPCPECEQEVVIEKVVVPCIIPVKPLDPRILPSYPPFPVRAAALFPSDADKEELKRWALRFGEVAEQREAILKARDVAWGKKVEAHNSGEPLCSD